MRGGWVNGWKQKKGRGGSREGVSKIEKVACPKYHIWREIRVRG